jgi:hypothetical protein
MPAKLIALSLMLLAAGLAPAQWPQPQPSRPSGVIPLTMVKEADPNFGAIQQVQNTVIAPRRTPGLTPEQIDNIIQLLPPDPQRMFRLYSEDELHEQIRQEDREKTPKDTKSIYPPERPVTDEPYVARKYPPQVCLAEPAYVNYKRLYFEDKNAERYGFDLGFVQPFGAGGLFFADLALLPYHFASRPLDCIQSSAGYCLPGDPVPYLLDPPNLSVTGSVGEAAAIIGLIAIFP